MTEDTANEFLGAILQEKGENIYRMKGFLCMKDTDIKFVFHSVGMLLKVEPFEEWEDGEKRECVFVIIGKHLQ